MGKLVTRLVWEYVDTVQNSAPPNKRKQAMLTLAWASLNILRSNATPGDADELQPQDKKGGSTTNVVRSRIQLAEAGKWDVLASQTLEAHRGKVSELARRPEVPPSARSEARERGVLEAACMKALGGCTRAARASTM